MQTIVDERAEVDAWRRAPEMAKHLGVSQRTIRNMVARGELERCEIDGLAYVRRPGTGSEPAGTVEAAAPEPTPEPAPEPADNALVIAAELRRLAEALAEASAGRAEALVLADVAVRDRDAARREALEAKELADLHRARAERAAVLAGELSRLPWWRFADRRRLADELVQLRLAG